MRPAPQFFAALLLAASASAGAERTLDELLACHDAAVGGDALRAVQKLEVEIDIAEPGFNLRGRYRATRAGQVRIDIFAGENRVFSEGWDGQQAWQLAKEATEPGIVSAEGAAALRHGLEQPGHFWTLADMRRNGHQLELNGREERGGTTYYVLELTLSDGFKNWYWVHPETCQIERNRNFRSFHPDLDPKRKWIETVFEDFRTEAGITKARRSRNVDLDTSDTLGTTTVLKIDLKPGFSAEAMKPGPR